MKIVVAIKQVPDTATQVKVSSDPKAIETTGVTWIVSPYDEFAVEEALRIKEKRGADYTEDEVRQLASVKLETFLDPRGVRSELVEHYRRRPQSLASSPPPDNFVFEDHTIYASHRLPLLARLRRFLNPVLKLFFNPNTVVHALHQQSRINGYVLQHVGRRQLGLAPGVLAAHVGDGAVEFAAQDDILVDDRGDPVDRLQAGVGRLGEGFGSTGQAGGHEEAREQFLHGVGSGTESLSV